MALYEGMFLISNDVVRTDWATAKARVTDLVAKHGGTVHTARRWDERPLAYSIKGKYRATFLLTYFEMDGQAVPAFRREVELKEEILRHLQIRADAVPDKERELAAAESAPDFAVPPPPEDTPPPIAAELFERPRDDARRRPVIDDEDLEGIEGMEDDGEAPSYSPRRSADFAEPVVAGSDVDAEGS